MVLGLVTVHYELGCPGVDLPRSAKQRIVEIARSKNMSPLDREE